jgi:type IV secretory pathway VirJ component
MKQIVRVTVGCLLIPLLLASTALSAATEETLRFGRFGTVTVYRQSPHPPQVILFVSGDGGWNQGVVEMAKELSSLNALVVGVDITHYLKELRTGSESCSYPAADFEVLSQFVQKSLAFPSYVPPVLVGYSSGATLVYATLVQAPPGTFRGAISLGFCPDLPLTKPLCRGHGLDWTPGPKGKGYSFSPAATLQTPWIALQGTIDQVCDPASTESYVRQVGGSRLVMLPKVGHGFSVERNWLPQLKDAFASLVDTNIQTQAPAPANVAVQDLPLVEVPAHGSSINTLAVILSGDGGWVSIDRELGRLLAEHGIPVVGLNSLQYFWTRRTPDGASADLERIMRHYLTTWHKEKAALIGYSLGADVLPFMVNRLPQDFLSRVHVVALLGPEPTVDFEFHVTDRLGLVQRSSALPVQPEVEKLKGLNLLCLYGTDERDSLCPHLDPKVVTVVPLTGGHHFADNYQAVAGPILYAGIGTTR